MPLQSFVFFDRENEFAKRQTANSITESSPAGDSNVQGPMWFSPRSSGSSKVQTTGCAAAVVRTRTNASSHTPTTIVVVPPSPSCISALLYPTETPSPDAVMLCRSGCECSKLCSPANMHTTSTSSARITSPPTVPSLNTSVCTVTFTQARPPLTSNLIVSDAALWFCSGRKKNQSCVSFFWFINAAGQSVAAGSRM